MSAAYTRSTQLTAFIDKLVDAGVAKQTMWMERVGPSAMVMKIIVQGRGVTEPIIVVDNGGEDGFELYFASPTISIDEDVKRIQEGAQA